uniref:Uncharacterized protein n=2 Tax=Oryza sativa subsp. japonica TaxID=39947 RepID=Q69J80_ORYSJ|nr:hypothetical protein [Oryza sativa Japonica Group]BAD31982.1 hypothetical protein [Oryza sativa Japonica Group]
MSVWKPTLGGQGACWRSALAAKMATEADDAGGEEKRKRKGETRAGRGGAESITTTMTAGAVWNGVATWAADADRRGRG